MLVLEPLVLGFESSRDQDMTSSVNMNGHLPLPVLPPLLLVLVLLLLHRLLVLAVSETVRPL